MGSAKRPKSAKSFEKKQHADEDEVEVENSGSDIEPEEEPQVPERPVTSRSRSRPTTAKQNPFLVQTAIIDDGIVDDIGPTNPSSHHGALVSNMLKIRDEVDQNEPSLEENNQPA